MREDAWQRVLAAGRAGPRTPVKRTDDRPIVLFHTPWARPDDGWSIASRVSARAMHLGGLNVSLASWGEPLSTTLTEDVMKEVGHLYQPYLAETDVHVFSSPLGPAELMRPVFVNIPGDRGRVFHAMFERQYLEPELVDGLNGLDGIWAQCSANAEVLEKAGVKNVTYIPFPFFPDDLHLKLPAPKESKKFYWIGREEPRKAPDNLVRAFLLAFRPGEASLTMKFSPYGHVGRKVLRIEDVIAAELHEPRTRSNGWTAGNVYDSIKLIRDRLSAEEMLRLHAENDVYVSASRGEGLDLPSFASKLAGRMLVTTDSGGPRDFLGDGDIMVPATGTMPVDPLYAWIWGPGATYSDYSMDRLIAALQEARGKTPCGSRVPAAHRAENVARKFREWVGGLLQR